MRRKLETVREINAAVSANINGRNDGVYCAMVDSTLYRVVRARTVRGQLQVRTFSGSWVVPWIVYQL